MPMKNFTPEEARPSELTLSIIRHIAHVYRVAKTNGKENVCCTS